jgi:dihydropteroate synthase
MNFCFKNREIMCRPGLLAGIVNVTPDSFSDGGKSFCLESAIRHGLQLLTDGAVFLDVGGESTRPGAAFVGEDEEINRIVPVISGLKHAEPECIISVDTRKANVAIAAIKAGADIVNDISSMKHSPEMAKIVADTGAGLILMHSRGNPQTMQDPENLKYDDVVKTVIDELQMAVDAATESGVSLKNIILDPGIGFAKTAEQNLELIARIDEFRTIGLPIMVGHSRKSFIGKVLGQPEPEMRDSGTAGVTLFLMNKSVDFIRVHNVRAMNDAITMFNLCSATTSKYNPAERQ